jgi:hypothetical protein
MISGGCWDSHRLTKENPMSRIHLLSAPLAALAALAVSAAPVAASPADAAHNRSAIEADTHDRPNRWYAGESTIQASTHSDTTKPNMFVLTPELGHGGAAAPSPAPPTWPPNPEPITGSHAIDNAPASGLDWGSAGIGAAAGIGAFAFALALAEGLRRRRIARPRSLTTH